MRAWVGGSRSTVLMPRPAPVTTVRRSSGSQVRPYAADGTVWRTPESSAIRSAAFMMRSTRQALVPVV
jgi:hypothetical protein